MRACPSMPLSCAGGGVRKSMVRRSTAATAAVALDRPGSTWPLILPTLSRTTSPVSCVAAQVVASWGGGKPHGTALGATYTLLVPPS